MARYVPPVFPPIPDPLPVNPLSLLSDVHLQQTQLLVGLTCHRSKTPTHARNALYVCYLDRILKAELERRHPPGP